MTPQQRKINCPNGITASGTKPKKNLTLACDKKFLGKKFYIRGYGERRCEDTGGAITGNRIDIFMHSFEESMKFGKQTVYAKEL
jgi:3D (Asp-Asp-Asp) domain-containing protein